MLISRAKPNITTERLMASLTLDRLALGLAPTGCAGLTHAAGFTLIEQNASGLGNAYAGQAVVAADASTIFFNPAGMTLLPDRQLVVAGHLIAPQTEFTGMVTPDIEGGNGGNAGGLAFVPNAYSALRLTPDVHLGLGLNSPFGLKTEYDPDWIGRYQAIKSEVKTINVNPSIAPPHSRWCPYLGCSRGAVSAVHEECAGLRLRPPVRERPRFAEH